MTERQEFLLKDHCCLWASVEFLYELIKDDPVFKSNNKPDKSRENQIIFLGTDGSAVSTMHSCLLHGHLLSYMLIYLF